MEWDGSPDGAYKIFVPLSMLLKYNCGGSTGNRDFVEMKTEQSSSKPLIAVRAEYLCVWVAAHKLKSIFCATLARSMLPQESFIFPSCKVIPGITGNSRFSSFLAN